MHAIYSRGHGLRVNLGTAQCLGQFLLKGDYQKKEKFLLKGWHIVISSEIVISGVANNSWVAIISTKDFITIKILSC